MTPIALLLVSFSVELVLAFLLYRIGAFKNHKYEAIVILLLAIAIDYLSYSRTAAGYELMLSDVSICEPNPDKGVSASLIY